MTNRLYLDEVRPLYENGGSMYHIKKGDNLWNIAKKYTGRGINYKELLKLNPQIKNEDLIYAGDTLTLPDSWKSEKKKEEPKKKEPKKKEEHNIAASSQSSQSSRPVVPTVKKRSLSQASADTTRHAQTIRQLSAATTTPSDTTVRQSVPADTVRRDTVRRDTVRRDTPRQDTVRRESNVDPIRQAFEKLAVVGKKKKKDSSIQTSQQRTDTIRQQAASTTTARRDTARQAVTNREHHTDAMRQVFDDFAVVGNKKKKDTTKETPTYTFGFPYSTFTNVDEPIHHDKPKEKEPRDIFGRLLYKAHKVDDERRKPYRPSDTRHLANYRPSPLADKIEDLGNAIRESSSASDFLQTVWNGVGKHVVEDSQVKTKKQQLRPTPTVTKDVLDEQFAQATRNGTDTLLWDRVPVDRTGNKYYIQESYPITDSMRFGSRNRLEYRDLASNNAPLTTYRPIFKYEDYIKGVNYNGKHYKISDKDSEGHQNHFIGYDKNGKFKVGPLSEFGPGDNLTQVFYSDIIGVPRDAKGNIQYSEDKRNRGRYLPVVDVYGEQTYDENGNVKRGQRQKGFITTMSKRRSFDGRYGNVSGGRVLLKVGNETRLVSGSIEHVIQEIELMQKNHKGAPVRYYQLDNGSYNRGLRTRHSQNITAQDLRDYDRQNTTGAGGGHFMYIRN